VGEINLLGVSFAFYKPLLYVFTPVMKLEFSCLICFQRSYHYHFICIWVNFHLVQKLRGEIA